MDQYLKDLKSAIEVEDGEDEGTSSQEADGTNLPTIGIASFQEAGVRDSLEPDIMASQSELGSYLGSN